MVNTSKIFRITFRVFLLVITVSLSLTSILGSLSAGIILTNFKENIVIDYSGAKLDPVNEIFTVPISINNTGYFPLEGLTLRIEINIKYEETKIAEIMDHTMKINESILASGSYDGDFTATSNSFTNHPEISPLDLENLVIISIEIGGYYSFRMLRFFADIDGIEVPMNWATGELGD